MKKHLQMKSVISFQDNEYQLISYLFDKSSQTSEPTHLDLVFNMHELGFDLNKIITLATVTVKPFSIEFHPKLTSKVKREVTKLLKNQLKSELQKSISSIAHLTISKTK